MEMERIFVGFIGRASGKMGQPSMAHCDMAQCFIFHHIARFTASKRKIMVKKKSFNMTTTQSGEGNWNNNDTYPCKYWVLLAWTANGRDVTIKEILKP